jgi:hypothetical protein
MRVTIVLHDPVNVGHEVASSFVKRFVYLELSLFDDECRLLPPRFEGKVEMSSDWFPAISTFLPQLIRYGTSDSLCSLATRLDKLCPGYKSVEVLFQTASYIDGHCRDLQRAEFVHVGHRRHLVQVSGRLMGAQKLDKLPMAYIAHFAQIYRGWEPQGHREAVVELVGQVVPIKLFSSIRLVARLVV